MSSRAAILLEKELFYFYDSLPWGIKIQEDSNIFEWKITLSGPKNTSWENSSFKLILYFDECFNQTPPHVYFLTVPFHPNIDVKTGKPCVSFLDDLSVWRSDIQIVELLVHLQNLLDEPELDSPVNEEAALMFKKSPKLYHQLARDAVVASRRLEQGMNMFDDQSDFQSSFEEKSSTHESGETSSHSQSEKKEVVETPIPDKTVNISFDSYYNQWLKTGTTMDRLDQPSGPIRPRKLLKFRTQHTKMSNEQIKKTLKTQQLIEFGKFPEILEKHQSKSGKKGKTNSKQDRIDDMKKMYTLAHVPDPVVIPSVPFEDVQRIPSARAHPNSSQWVDEVDELVHWSQSLAEQDIG
ncbi:ubiquitin-conjugating enzyme/RWD-like protein [Globomyces pollinis-pini]|nr:ubiquitin-conjugating enzyme/RWD-like protein [Globomyces pollinis-pini]